MVDKNLSLAVGGGEGAIHFFMTLLVIYNKTFYRFLIVYFTDFGDWQSKEHVEGPRG